MTTETTKPQIHKTPLTASIELIYMRKILEATQDDLKLDFDLLHDYLKQMTDPGQTEQFNARLGMLMARTEAMQVTLKSMSTAMNDLALTARIKAATDQTRTKPQPEQK